MSFEGYCTTIGLYPDRYFNILLIDGRARPSCVVQGVEKVAEGGILVLDNSDRDRYQAVTGLFRSLSWRKRSYFGPGPYRNTFWETTVWRRPAAGRE